MPIELERGPLVRDIPVRGQLLFAYIHTEGVFETYSTPPVREWYEPIEDES